MKQTQFHWVFFSLALAFIAAIAVAGHSKPTPEAVDAIAWAMSRK